MQKYYIVTKECPQCHKDFTCKNAGSEYKETCSRACSNVFFAAKRNTLGKYEKVSKSLNEFYENKEGLLKNTIRKCEYCEREFTSNVRKQRFCSRSCGGKQHWLDHPGLARKVGRNPSCYTEKESLILTKKEKRSIEGKAWRAKKNAEKLDSMDGPLICHGCNAEVIISHGQGPRKYCNRSCAGKHYHKENPGRASEMGRKSAASLSKRSAFSGQVHGDI